MGGRARVVTGAKHGVSHLSYRQNFLLAIQQYCRFLKIPLFFFNLLVFYIRSLKQFKKVNTEQVNLYTYIVV